MIIPGLLAIVLFWVGVLSSGRAIAAVEMAVMVPAMIAVMLLRRTEYSQPVHTHARVTVGPSSEAPRGDRD